MYEILNSIKLKKITIIFFGTFFMGAILFARSFIGITVFGFRIGELFMAVSLLALILSISFLENETINKVKEIYLLLLLVFVGFLVSSNLSNSSFFDPYTYRASSYIWTVGFLFLGIWFSKDFTLKKNSLITIQLILLIVYVVSIFDYPNIFQNFFYNYSDKYELHKGSDLLLIFIVLNYILFNNSVSSEFVTKLFFFNSALYMPLFLFKSRAAFIAALIYITLEVFTSKKIKYSFNLLNIFYIFFIFVVITFSTFYSQRYVVEEFSSEILSEIPTAYKQLGEYKFSKYQEEYPILYYSNGRIFSGDGNLNWRLQLWQDSIDDLKEDKSQIFGNGYKDKFRVFVEDNLTCSGGKPCGNDRKGLDGLNQNVHNYLLTVYLRGGFYHLALFMFINLVFLVYVVKNHKLISFLKFYLPVMFVSFFDSSMENAHFPLIVYFFLGYYFINNQN